MVNVTDPWVFLREIGTFQVVLSTFNAVLFLGGASGNVYVIALIAHIMHYGGRRAGQSRHLFLYILCLSCVDLICLSNLIFIICDLMFTTWIFGLHLCQYYLTMENLSKTLSIFVLTVMVVDRYLTICRRNTVQKLRKTWAILAAMSACATVSGLLLIPLPRYATIEAYHYSTELHVHMPGQNVTVFIKKCRWNASVALHDIFSLYMFVICFLFPGIIIVSLYMLILRAVRKHARTNSNSSLPIKRLTTSILLLQIFYFSCWTPNWMFTIFNKYVLTQEQIISPVLIIITYVVYALPYVNSAFNPVFYALMNKEFRRGHRTANEYRQALRTQAAKSSIGPAQELTVGLISADNRKPFNSAFTYAGAGLAERTEDGTF